MEVSEIFPIFADEKCVIKRKIAMSRITLFVTCLLASTVMIAQDNKPNEIKLTKEEKQLVQNNNDFAFRLFREGRKENNRILSPLSITYALGMLNNGATGQTQKEINTVLGFDNADAINQFCRKLLTEAPLLDKETTVCIADNIYMNMGYVLQEEFAEKAFKYYDAQPETRNFYDGVTRDVINQWGSDHTDGMIKEALSEEEFNPDAVSYLLNALYFKGLWANKFDAANTADELFNGGDKVPMMHIYANDQGEGCSFEYMENDLYQALKMPYGSGAYRMTVFLPQKGKTLDDMLKQMDGENWQFRGKTNYVDLKFPRFETKTDIDLVPVMSALGMPSAFSEMKAEFPYFCNTDAFIGMMKQVAKISVNEEGSEASAVTVIEMDKSSISFPEKVEFHATRPFLYIISEQSTGVILFIGQYTGDGTANIQDVKRQKETMTNDKVYNLNGQRLLTPPAHGLYIQEGRKMLK